MQAITQLLFSLSVAGLAINSDFPVTPIQASVHSAVSSVISPSVRLVFQLGTSFSVCNFLECSFTLIPFPLCF